MNEKGTKSKEDGYSREYDAYYDKKTMEWTEPKCGDLKCEFCAYRPDTAEGMK